MHRFSASSFLYFSLDALFQCINIRFYPNTPLLHENNQVLAGAPENLRVGDAESILLVGITNQSIRA